MLLIVCSIVPDRWKKAQLLCYETSFFIQFYLWPLTALGNMTNVPENLNYTLALWTLKENKTKLKFILSFINFPLDVFFFLSMIYIWVRDKGARPETLSRARPPDTWYIERCVSKANIVMNWICVYVCGLTLGCLWRCPKSNTTISRINRPPFSIPRSPEMKRSFFHNYHLRQSIAGELDLSLHNPSPLTSHQPWAGVAPLPRKLLWTAGKCTSPKKKWHWPPSHTDSTPNHRSSYKSLKRGPTPMYGNTINIDVGESSSKAASVAEH